MKFHHMVILYCYVFAVFIMFASCVQTIREKAPQQKNLDLKHIEEENIRLKKQIESQGRLVHRLIYENQKMSVRERRLGLAFSHD